MIVLRVTPSQYMALRLLVAEHLLCPGATEVYVDVFRGVDTTPSELLLLLMDADQSDEGESER